MLDPQTSFTRAFREQIAQPSRTLSKANLETECLAAVKAFADLGFVSNTDLGYAMLQLGLRAGLTREELLQCIPKAPALAAGRLKDSFWAGVPDIQRFSEQDVYDANPDADPDAPGIQPSYAKMLPRLDNLVVGLGKIARNDLPQPQAAALLDRSLGPQVTIVDRTAANIVGDTAAPATPEQVARLLIEKGITRFGCYAPATDQLDPPSDGIKAVFLGFKVPRDAKDATSEDALLFRPLFKNGKISVLRVANDGKWIEAVLTGKGWCGDLKIRKASPAQPAAAADNADRTVSPMATSGSAAVSAAGLAAPLSEKKRM
ncbi:hypothetical protein [Ancylobacter sp.]|uniref:hypothetical protein n=1 Tax=Ancylobacter sp. TaxID=1872567 RepID=UPI003D0AADDB